MNNLQPTEQQIDLITVLQKRGYFVTKEVANLLHVNERTIIRWRRLREKGENVGIPFVKIEKTYAYFPHHIEEYIKRNTY